MVIRGEGGSVTMHVQGIEQHPLGLGDLQLTIEVESSGFGGKGSAWVTAGALRRFLADARQLEMTRRGSATLESISPKELVLTIQSVDGAGHVAVVARLARQKWTGDRRSYPHVIEIGFEFDPTMLPSITSDFAGWANALPPLP